MIYTMLTSKAMEIAYNAHHGQKDVNGVPYIFHPMHVAEGMKDELTTCVAILHDVVEDTDVTMEELSEVFPENVIECLKILTHDDSEDYFEYIKRIAANPVAKIVKLGDLAHNMDESRIYDKTTVSEEQLNWWRFKYEKALNILSQS
ncbi:MAG: HD domain-containing protein [Lachnospiraceae bacterium]|nr:HD domain-containing protein [Lachnospiraceae bacterium]